MSRTCDLHCGKIIKNFHKEIYFTFQNATREIDPATLGSSHRLVVTSDGAWRTRGYHSKNGTFVIIDYLTQGLLWKSHLSQKGRGEDVLYKGTSKSMEAYQALELFTAAKDEGFIVEVVWQVRGQNVLEHESHYLGCRRQITS